ncbi:hypothetical protein, partial [Bradyrhizobium sp. Ghvi]|uniref:hypothetical protein n=1 Tax=Bradyrhizobium sp. Ghvi TaxID=1855319 RepID=UPI001AECDAC8
SNNSCAMKDAARKHRAAAVRARIYSGSADGLSWPALVLVPPCSEPSRTALWAAASGGLRSLTAPARGGAPGGVGTKGVPTIDRASGGSNNGRSGELAVLSH